jgi:6-phosphogluconolactonase (cycloisomerase 2 family)
MAMKVRALLSSVVLLSTMWLVSCGHYVCGTTFGSSTCTSSGGGISQGGGGNGVTQTAFVYFMSDGAAGMALEGLNVADSKTFAPVPSFVSPTFPTNTLGSDGGIAIVNKTYLYMPFANGFLYGFSIDAATGALTPVPTSHYTLMGSGSSIAADPAGHFLFVGGSSGISVFTVSATDGSLTPAPGSPFATASPVQLATDGKGRYLYAVGGSGISAFSYNQVSGVLTPVTGSPFNPFLPATMAQVEGESTGTYLVGTTAEAGAGSGVIDRNLYVFGITQATGALTKIAATATVYSPVYMTVSPNGKFVYSFNEDDSLPTNPITDPIEGYAISSTGALTPVSGSPFLALTATIGKFDQSGQYLFSEVFIPNSASGSTFAYGADTSLGGLTSTLPHAGAPSTSFAVTDEP